jgi:hypothetical protein
MQQSVLTKGKTALIEIRFLLLDTRRTPQEVGHDPYRLDSLCGSNTRFLATWSGCWASLPPPESCHRVRARNGDHAFRLQLRGGDVNIRLIQSGELTNLGVSLGVSTHYPQQLQS